MVTATNYSKICKAGKKMLLEHGFEIIENPHGRPMTFTELKEVAGDVSAVVAGVDTWNEDVFALSLIHISPDRRPNPPGYRPHRLGF